VERDFTASVPDRLWVADITDVPTWAGFLYLAVVLDAFSRRIVGWSMATTLATRLVLDALNMALMTRRPRGVIHHSDQGSQCTSIEFGHRCREAGVRPSMGSVGDAYDNAMCESFFATLECELLGAFALLFAAQASRGWPQGVAQPMMFSVQAKAVGPHRQGSVVGLAADHEPPGSDRHPAAGGQHRRPLGRGRGYSAAAIAVWFHTRVRRAADRGSIVAFRAPNVHYQCGEEDRRGRRFPPRRSGTPGPHLARDNPALYPGRQRGEAKRHKADLIGGHLGSTNENLGDRHFDITTVRLHKACRAGRDRECYCVRTTVVAFKDPGNVKLVQERSGLKLWVEAGAKRR
jgi:transposase InsO family protein